ncbi:MAG: hypothetical protein IPJ00_13025 [Saprospirales bacterium]|nr:hypothetical protein [Saprospirales bacterium]
MAFSLDHIEVFRDALIRHALERDVEKRNLAIMEPSTSYDVGSRRRTTGTLVL